MTYCVNTKTQEEYDELMDILEKQGKIYINNSYAIKINYWVYYKENTVIKISNVVSIADNQYYSSETEVIISLEEYKQIVNSEKPKIAEQTEETFTRGELVEVSSNNNYWYKRIFLVEIK